MKYIIAIFAIFSIVMTALPLTNNGAFYPEPLDAKGYMQPVPLYFRFINTNGSLVQPQSVYIAISNSTEILYSGPAIKSGTVYLYPGLYSLYGQNPSVGFNATLVNVTGPTNITLRLVPYTMGSLIDTKHHREYYRPTDPRLVLYTVFGINQSDQLPAINRLPGSNQQTTNRPQTAPAIDCIPYWVLWKTSPINSNGGWVKDVLQGAVFSWAGEDGLKNQPTVTQSTTIYSYTSSNGGPVSESSAIELGWTTTTTLPEAFFGQDYNVYADVQFYDYIYRQYACGFYLNNEKEVFEMTQISTWYEINYGATNLSDYSFQPYKDLIVSSNNTSQVFYITFGQIGTRTQSFSAMLSLSISPSITGGEFSGSFDLAGYTSLNSQTQSTEVMYTITAYGSCLGYEAYDSGWVLGWGSGPGC